MAISIEEVQRIAGLAKLEFEPAELQRLSKQLGSILAYIERLEEVRTDEVPVDAAPAAGEAGLRADEPQRCLEPEQALANAPETAADHFRVPRVIA